MSDEYGDAADQAGDGATGPLEPALAERLDTMSALGSRIDALRAEIRTLQEAQDQLGRSVTESLDRFGDRTTGIIEEIREALLDAASGEVVGALWDEFRGTRTDFNSLDAAVRNLLDQAEAVDEAGDVGDGGMLSTVAADVASLRGELARGLVVEPSDALTGAVDQLRADVAGLDNRLAAIGELRQAVADLRGAVAESAAAPAPVVGAGPDPALARADDDVTERLVGIDGELRAMRSGIEDIIGRLDEGLVLADEIVPPAPGVPPEVDLAEVTELLEHVRDDIAALPDRIGAPQATGERYATLDPDIVDLLREEIRAARGAPDDAISELRDEIRSVAASSAAAEAVPDDLLDGLRKELVALRRRIKLRAEGEVLSDDQLQVIADAVARKLGE